jgi:hypothetical protein
VNVHYVLLIFVSFIQFSFNIVVVVAVVVAAAAAAAVQYHNLNGLGLYGISESKYYFLVMPRSISYHWYGLAEILSNNVSVFNNVLTD